MIEINENNLPVSPLKKLKILSENQNVQNKTDNHVTKYETEVLLKTKMPQFTSPKTDENNLELDEDVKNEPLLIESNGQYVIFPIKYDDMWHMYKSFVENFWSATESIEHLEALNFTSSELEFLKQIIAFLASFNSLGLVTENFAEDFSKIMQVTEAKFFYGHQLFVQNIHFEMYNRLIETMIKNEDERNKFYDDIEKIEAVKQKRNLIKAWYEEKHSFGERIVASACMYGLLFTVINVIKEWFKVRSVDQTFNHELIEIIDRMIVDFDLERDFACLMLHYVKRRPSLEFIDKLIEETGRVEKEFLLNGLNLGLIQINEKTVTKLIDSRVAALKLKIKKAMDTNKRHYSSNQESTERNDRATNEESFKSSTTINTPVIDKNIRFDEDF